MDKLTREGMETLYVIEVEKGESELDLFYSSTGILVKTILLQKDMRFRLSRQNTRLL